MSRNYKHRHTECCARAPMNCALPLGNVGRISSAAFPSNRKLTPIQNSDIIFLFFPCQNFAEKKSAL